MNYQLRFLFVLVSILMIAHRSPAPIVEQTETPAPTPAAETSKPTPKTKRKSAEGSEESKSAEPAKPKEPPKPKDRFAGTWSGKTNMEVWGDLPLTLTFSAGGSQVTEHSSFGTYTHAATSNGQTITWKSGLLSEVSWSFTPNSDGNTAQVTDNSPLGVNGNATFHRGGTPAVQKVASEFPVAKPVPERPGFVYNPFDPISRVFIDVRGKPSGSKLVDPKSGKTFLVP